MEGRIVVPDADCGFALVFGHPGGDGHQSAGEQSITDFELFVAGFDVALVGHDPHLHEMDGLVVNLTGETPRVVLLRMQDAAAGAHPLRQSGVDDPAVAGGVLVDQRALEHPGDDLHVAVGVGIKSRTRCHDVIVAHHQQSVVGVRRVVVVAEREGMFGVQPPESACEAVFGTADVHGLNQVCSLHGGGPFWVWVMCHLPCDNIGDVSTIPA